MSEELKPCPFCGGKAYIDVSFNQLYITARHAKKCLINPNTWLMSTEPIRKQIKAWNRRDGENHDES